jgi:VanZ family protein
MPLPRTIIASFRLALVLAVLVATYIATAPLMFPPLADINDKVLHGLAFFVLAFLLDFSFPRSEFGFSKAFALLLYGIGIEVVQYFLPFRSFSALDVGADGIGIAAYYFSLPALRRLPLLRLRWKSG